MSSLRWLHLSTTDVTEKNNPHKIAEIKKHNLETLPFLAFNVTNIKILEAIENSRFFFLKLKNSVMPNNAGHFLPITTNEI